MTKDECLRRKNKWTKSAKKVGKNKRNTHLSVCVDHLGYFPFIKFWPQSNTLQTFSEGIQKSIENKNKQN